MKNLIIYLGVFVTLISINAEMYPGTLYYNDGKIVETNIQVPSNTFSKTLVIDKGGKKTKIDSDLLSRFDITINGKSYTFAYGRALILTKNKSIKSPRKLWAYKLMEYDGDLEYFLASTNYKVNKNGEIVIIGSTQYATMWNLIKKKSDKDFILVSQGGGAGTIVVGQNRALKKAMQKYLGDCPAIISQLDNTKDLSLGEVVEMYNNCEK